MRLIVTDRRTTVPTVTAAGLGAIAALHLAWAAGSSFPFPDRAALADRVIGSNTVPGAGPCVAVAAALTIAGAAVGGLVPGPPPLARTMSVGVAAVLATRGVLGLAGRTDLVSPGSESVAFRRLDRRVYSPLCLALSIGALVSSRR
jgi:hypothetical protein